MSLSLGEIYWRRSLPQLIRSAFQQSINAFHHPTRHHLYFHQHTVIHTLHVLWSPLTSHVNSVSLAVLLFIMNPFRKSMPHKYSQMKHITRIPTHTHWQWAGHSLSNYMQARKHFQLNAILTSHHNCGNKPTQTKALSSTTLRDNTRSAHQ